MPVLGGSIYPIGTDHLIVSSVIASKKQELSLAKVSHCNHIRPHSALSCRPPLPQDHVPKLIHNQPIMMERQDINTLFNRGDELTSVHF